MDETTISNLQEVFLDWYETNKRQLPWRENQEPYYVWLSEIMLQQTRVQTVIPYFQHFVQTFPNLHALATAEDGVLMKCWEGLGYYSRARNLKRAAQQIEADYHGKFPKTAIELTEIVGIGPYTAGAIASIAFGEDVPAVDGNAYRVFSRIFADGMDISQSKAPKYFRTLIQPLLPKGRAGDFNQAVMDLGSSICTPKDPACLLCPLQRFCKAYQQGNETDYPVKTKKIKKKKVTLVAMVLQDQTGAYLFQKRPKTGLLADLVTFPLIDQADLPKEATLESGVTTYFQNQYNLTLEKVAPIQVAPVTHIFTHLHWTIHLMTGQIKAPVNLDYFLGYFIQSTEFSKQAFPTLQKKLWQQLR